MEQVKDYEECTTSLMDPTHVYWIEAKWISDRLEKIPYVYIWNTGDLYPTEELRDRLEPSGLISADWLDSVESKYQASIQGLKDRMAQVITKEFGEGIMKARHIIYNFDGVKMALAIEVVLTDNESEWVILLDENVHDFGRVPVSRILDCEIVADNVAHCGCLGPGGIHFAPDCDWYPVN